MPERDLKPLKTYNKKEPKILFFGGTQKRKRMLNYYRKIKVAYLGGSYAK